MNFLRREYEKFRRYPITGTLALVLWILLIYHVLEGIE